LDAQIGLGNAYQQKGWIELAIIHFQKALELAPDRFLSEYHCKLGDSLKDRGRIPEAIAGGRIAPRSFLKLFVLAAEVRLEQSEFFEESINLLQPSDLQGALMNTSEERIRELKDEYPWLESLKNSLRGLEAPIQKDIFLDALQTSGLTSQQLPSTSSEGLLQYLLQLGIIESRSDGRINMPEIYLHGFGVKRKGGVKRPH
jgi:tetratricopeptide (TPR) repeat protein